GSMGEVYERLGRLDDALMSYEQCWRVRERLAEVDPTNARVSGQIAWVTTRMGDVLHAKGDYAAAFDRYHRAFEIRARQAKVEEAGGALTEDLALSEVRLGEIRLHLGEFEEALEYFGMARADSERLVQNRPTYTLGKGSLGLILFMEGRAHDKLGHHDKAVAAWERGLEFVGPLVGEDSNLDMVATKAELLISLGRREEAMPLIEDLARRDYRDKIYVEFCEESRVATPAKTEHSQPD
ncbi:tetratricopeptide repeat protein, partial [Candidatus Poribacteria bacterium]|nr:tetratricopeptide repeat protein [Candidatus Poribacteria bacterium]